MKNTNPIFNPIFFGYFRFIHKITQKKAAILITATLYYNTVPEIPIKMTITRMPYLRSYVS